MNFRKLSCIFLSLSLLSVFLIINDCGCSSAHAAVTIPQVETQVSHCSSAADLPQPEKSGEDCCAGCQLESLSVPVSAAEFSISKISNKKVLFASLRSGKSCCPLPKTDPEEDNGSPPDSSSSVPRYIEHCRILV